MPWQMRSGKLVLLVMVPLIAVACIIVAIKRSSAIPRLDAAIVSPTTNAPVIHTEAGSDILSVTPRAAEDLENPPKEESRKSQLPPLDQNSELAQVKTGWGTRKDDDEIVEAKTWDEFYEHCKHPMIAASGNVYEDLIFKRLSKELGLTSDQAKKLRDVIRGEQVGISDVIFKDYGGSVKFYEKVVADAKAGSHSLWDEVSARRETLRRSYDASYLEFISPSQLELVNAHLRNQVITLRSTHTDGVTYYVLWGIGVPRKW